MKKFDIDNKQKLTVALLAVLEIFNLTQGDKLAPKEPGYNGDTSC